MADIDARYQDDYAAWKGWISENQFGTLSAEDKAYFDKELRFLGPKKSVRVLEIGFGNGNFLSYARQRGWQVSGTELGASLVSAAQAAGFEAVDGRELTNLPDYCFDLIVGFDVLEHIPEKELATFLDTLRVKLAPGGSIVLRFPNADSWLGMCLQNGDTTHVARIGLRKLMDLCSRSGLRIVHFRPQAFSLGGKSPIRKLHTLIATPLARAAALYQRLVYFPGYPYVLSTSNVVAILAVEDASRRQRGHQ